MDARYNDVNKVGGVEGSIAWDGRENLEKEVRSDLRFQKINMIQKGSEYWKGILGSGTAQISLPKS